MSAAAAPVAHPPAVPLRRTPLYGFHTQRQAHLVPFNGWEMPLNYGSILEEYRAVREAVGLFDVGHMGILTVGGVHAPDLLSRRTTADVGRIVPGQCRYTFITEFTGSILDDMLVTRLDAGEGRAVEFLAVPNAGRAGKVTELLMEHRRPDTSIAVHNGALTILAVQGPGSRHLLETTFGWSLEPLRFYHARFYPASPASSIPRDGILGATFPDPQGAAILVSRTGYTGELGYELFVRGTDAIAVATRLEAGGARACGLAARDMLRLEKGYLLSGQDFNHDRTPLEAAQEKFVDFNHPFVGRDVLEAQRKEGVKLRLAGLRVDAPGAIPRHGTPVLHETAQVSHVTSGGLSPALDRGIALAYLPPPLDATGTRLELDLRGRRVEAHVVPLPFVPSGAGRRVYPPT